MPSCSLAVRQLVLFLLLCCTGISWVQAGGNVPQRFDENTFRELDYGLYWFGHDGTYAKSVKGSPNPYYNPHAPTVIYVHGWEVGETRRLYREVFEYGFLDGPEENLAEAWLNDGWNVGVFYWNQFSDEWLPNRAEAKIWTPASVARMRWRDSEGALHYDAPDQSVSRLFFDAYRDAMKDYQGPHIRIVGHSFGNQLAIALAHQVLDATRRHALPQRLLPQRLALLDPAYMGGNRLFLQQKTTQQQALGYARELVAAGVLLEAYRTSMMMEFTPFTDKAEALLRLTALTDVPTWYFPPWDFQKKHVAAVWHYFWSYQFEPPGISGSQAPGLSASTPDARVKQLMRSPFRLLQVQGKFSTTPAGDRMLYWPKPSP